MKIALVHLSDIHFAEKDTRSQKHADKIVCALRQVGHFDSLFFIVSGDIAHSGEKCQYDNATSFLNRIRFESKRMFYLAGLPTMQIVPGNHDVCLDPAFDRKALEAMEKTGQCENQISCEMKKMCNYYCFARSFGCSTLSSNLLYTKRYDLDGYLVEFNLINSALFSMREQDKGLHYLPYQTIEKLKEPSEANLIVSIMHHSFHWFGDYQKSLLESALFSNADILFLGHEHIEGNQSVISDQNPATLLFAGGMLSNQDNWIDSQFCVYVIDTDKYNIQKSVFDWDEKQSLYVLSVPSCIPFVQRRTKNIPFIVRESYMRQLFIDEKNSIPKDYNEYFIFPRLRKQDTGGYINGVEYADSASFMKCIHKNRRISIVGADNSGKTSLLKHIFRELSSTTAILYCSSTSIQSGNRKRIVRSLFEDIYSDDPAKYSSFMQLDKEKKAIIIDDVHRISKKHFAEFTSGIEDEFGYIVLGSASANEFDIVERLKASITESAYSHYQICPFYSDKRKALLDKLCGIYCPENQDISELMADALKQQEKFLSFTPDTIIKFFMFYHGSMAEATRNDGSIFGKVFEASLVDLVSPFTKRMSVDKLFTILDKIAYSIHINRLYPIPQDDLLEVIATYKKDYGTIIDSSQFINTVIDSKLMLHDQEKNAYYFRNKTHLAYFIAREVHRRFIDEGDSTELKRMLEFSCFGINSDILILLTYIADNTRMLQNILDAATQYLSDWAECDLDKGNIPLIEQGVYITAHIPDHEEIKQSEISELKREKERSEALELKVYDIYNFEEKDVEDLYYQLIRAVSLLTVLSRCLPNFEHRMPAQMKNQFVQAIYKLPQKIYFKWAIVISSNIDMIVEVLKMAIDEARQTNPKQREWSRTELLETLRNDVVMQYLNFLYLTVPLSAKKNTIDTLNQFDYKNNTPYQLLHIMMLEKVHHTADFISESQTLLDLTKSETVKSLLRQIVRHFIVHNKNLPYTTSQQLEQRFFEGQTHHPQMLMERHKTH